jgi:hypothetical protein
MKQAPRLFTEGTPPALTILISPKKEPSKYLMIDENFENTLGEQCARRGISFKQ